MFLVIIATSNSQVFFWEDMQFEWKTKCSYFILRNGQIQLPIESLTTKSRDLGVLENQMHITEKESAMYILASTMWGQHFNLLPWK